MDDSSIAFLFVILKVAIVAGTIRPNLDTAAVTLFSEPLTCILHFGGEKHFAFVFEIR